MEKELLQQLGADNLKNIGVEIAEIIRKYDLQNSPDVCRKLFCYLSDVIDGWNTVSGQSNSE